MRLILVAVSLWVGFGFFPLYADEGEQVYPSGSHAKVFGVAKVQKQIQKAETSSDQTVLVSRLESLERRVADIERYNRFQDDSIRQLDRDVDDYKRRL